MNESNKFKYGMIFLVMGVLLIVWAWGSWTLRIVPDPIVEPAYETSTIDADIDTDEDEGVDEANNLEDDNTRDEANALTGQVSGTIKPRDKVNINAWRYALFVLLALFLTVLLGSYVLIRAARRYRARADHDRAAPTSFEDVWSSHKLPKG